MLLDKDDTTYQEHHSRFLKKLWQRARSVLQVTYRRFHNVSGTCCKSLEEDVTTYQEHLASYLKNVYNVSGRSCKLLASRKMLQVSGTSCMLLDEDVTTFQEHRGSWRSCDNVPWTSCKLLAEDFTTYQERVASHLKKMVQRIRNIWQVTWRKVYDVSGRSCKLLTSRKMLHVAGTSCMLLDEDATTYKDHHSSYLKKMWQRARNVLQVTCRRFHSVSGTLQVTRRKLMVWID